NTSAASFSASGGSDVKNPFSDIFNNAEIPWFLMGVDPKDIPKDGFKNPRDLLSMTYGDDEFPKAGLDLKVTMDRFQEWYNRARNLFERERATILYEDEYLIFAKTRPA